MDRQKTTRGPAPSAPPASEFAREEAFSRNIGWVTREEQASLRAKCVAIAGMGGVGGAHLLTLARLGVGAFRISDFDVFEVANFNRQAGASMSHLGRPKVDVMAEMALDVNPELEIRRFGEGVHEENVHEFLEGADLYLDGIDFFAVDARRRLFAACTELGIPAVTAAPLGMGAALLNFLPGRMTFEEYFRLEGQIEEEQLLRFLVGLAPARLHGGYLVDPSSIDIANHKGPSTPMAADLCAGLAAAHVLKILLGRGPVPAAPHGLHFDAYRNKLVHTWRPGGNRHPLQRLMLFFGRRQFLSKGLPPGPERDTPVERILDTARWAPSGDNTQPWRFEVVDGQHVVVHGRDTRDHCVYDLDGRASQVSLGALIETITIAATREGMRAEAALRRGSPPDRPSFDVRLTSAPGIETDPLSAHVRTRSTQRRPMRTRPLETGEKAELERAAGPGHRVIWLESTADRKQMARLLFRSAWIRLTTKEAWEVHHSVIQWGVRYSEDRMPAASIGMDPVTTRLMGWVMRKWGRVKFMNRFLAGTLLPRLKLDAAPAKKCAAHFFLVANEVPAGLEAQVAAGRSLQRFWLTATKLGLFVQPEMTPLIFSRYVREGVEFTESVRARKRADEIAARLTGILGEENAGRLVFMGRIGAGSAPRSRSVRLPLPRLLLRRKT